MFIILHDSPDGDEVLINVKSIQAVNKNKIYLTFGDYTVMESYEEIKKKIKDSARYSTMGAIMC